MIDFATLLQMMVDQNSSDLFVTAGVAPSIKTHGVVRPACEEKFSAEQAREMCYGIMNERQRTQLENTFECQFAISARGIGRFRVSTFIQRGNVGMVVRKIETKIPTLEELQVPMGSTLAPTPTSRRSSLTTGTKRKSTRRWYWNGSAAAIPASTRS